MRCRSTSNTGPTGAAHDADQSLYRNTRCCRATGRRSRTTSPVATARARLVAADAVGRAHDNRRQKTRRRRAARAQKLHVKMKVDLLRLIRQRRRPRRRRRRRSLDTTWDLVAADAPIKRGRRSSAIPRPLRNRSRSTPRSPTSRSPPCGHVDQICTNVPVPLACKIILRSGDREWEGGHIYVTRNAVRLGNGGQVKDFDAKMVDVILRPDPATALNTIEMHEYWTGEAVIKNVTVTHRTVTRGVLPLQFRCNWVILSMLYRTPMPNFYDTRTESVWESAPYWAVRPSAGRRC